ncbi:hypothetical protein [Nisaea sp.]|uniref:hypothetical protein n=1 Tax=Nisaea sp. TaxID=2024842 RepID=UPI002B272B2E|nr:hypothetical protein [Nisaea sp.]
MIDFGTLVDVPLREAWMHEAHQFTPWLADHLDQLSREIGLELELEGREVAVESFSADILARNLGDGSLVLIENQLEKTDHTHLGQILTYLAGLEASTVIWIASEFREAHLSAVNWLNEHTTEEFAFIAVRVKVVRIGDSPLAPVFDVLARPNQWDRKVKSMARESASGPISEITKFRESYWAHLIDRYPGEAQLGHARTSSRWLSFPELGLIVTQFVGQDKIGVFIRGPRAGDRESTVITLETNRDQLDKTIGVPFEDGGKTNYFYMQTLSINGRDPKNWDRMADWHHEMTEKYRAGLGELSMNDD